MKTILKRYFQIDRNVRRLDVLRAAHQRTLHAIMPDYVAHLLRNSCTNNSNDVNLYEEIQEQQNNVSSDTRMIPMTLTVSTFNNKKQ